ncbi:peroxiredoxin [Flavobacterium sp. ASW18X]|uniref:peroxiredoxin family protein n=1 Tax=Flavobacterium sp. ASW18X TaxID=2572595 RepID=UPI0010AE2D10|nr:TlpA disulfide reductase family protein [Flavobacterium sp. ASW18X]TKD65884.1 TlpA family protein disulfide reductase [Flavobacterium sp. ASW18X]
MLKKIVLLLLCVVFFACKETPKKPSLNTGPWRAVMEVSEGHELPFTFMLQQQDSSYVMTISNADEKLTVDEIMVKGDSIRIQMPVFEGYINATFTENRIAGNFIKESLGRSVPFEASYGEAPRFSVQQDAKASVSGIWKAEFEYDLPSAYMAKGIFYQSDDKVTGTIRTTTGDYRYLEGVMDGDSLKLSTFDGAHVFLFLAKVEDNVLNGKFYSGKHYVANFKGSRDETYELPDANELTFLKEGYETFDFSFPDVDGQMVSLSDDQFKDKPVLVQIMGTWCPNCLDETKFYVEYLQNNPDADVEMVALAFEYARTEEKAFEGIKRLKKRVGVDYPILLAQVGTSAKDKANEKLPMLNHVLSYPTTIYIDKKGAVRKIHTGFNGPATGEKYEEFKKEFDKTIKELLNE